VPAPEPVIIACKVCLTKNRVPVRRSGRCGACRRYEFTEADVIAALRTRARASRSPWPLFDDLLHRFGLQ
jgi:hypothetical protein